MGNASSQKAQQTASSEHLTDKESFRSNKKLTNTTDDHDYSVSVVIPAHNAQDHLARAIDSILAQTLCPNEIIVVDDGSTDNTKEVAQSYGDSVHYIYQPNAGPSAARNTAIKAAASKWIAFLDADDEWLKDKLQLQTDTLKRDKDLTWIAGNYIRCLCDTESSAPQSKLEDINTLPAGHDHFEDFIDAFKDRAFGCTITMMIRRDILAEAGPFNTDYLLAEDIDLWLRIAYKHPMFGYVKEPIAIYHLDTPNSLSRKKQTYEFLCSFVGRHLKLAAEHERSDKFKPLAAQMITDWIRASLFDENIKHIRSLLKQFNTLLPSGTKTLFYLLTIFPPLTIVSCKTLSMINQRLRIRKKLMHPTE